MTQTAEAVVRSLCGQSRPRTNLKRMAVRRDLVS
jgi:hypothetical protein